MEALREKKHVHTHTHKTVHTTKLKYPNEITISGVSESKFVPISVQMHYLILLKFPLQWNRYMVDHSVWVLCWIHVSNSGNRPWRQWPRGKSWGSTAQRWVVPQESCSEVVTCSIRQGRTVGSVSDRQGVDLWEGRTWWQAVLLDGAGTSRALLAICIVQFLDRQQQQPQKS